MNTRVKSKLEKLRADYAQIKGQPFMHFYCPILFKDEDVPLCEGHIINKVFPNTPRDWTVQREDVDSFYGSRFESGFIAFVEYHTENLSPDKVIVDKKLSKKFNPKILVDGESVDYYVAQGDIPDHFTEVRFDSDRESVRLGLKLSPEDFDAVVDQNWEIEASKYAIISSLVSLIKSAHLTLFEMMGYDYVFSNEGRFVGQKILGEFFHNNHNIKSKSKVLENASQFFHEFSNMVRPVVANSSDPRFNHQGTIVDKRSLVCKGSGDFIWARIVFIKTSEMLHSVMLPVFDHPNAVATFLSFLQNDNEVIDVKLCHFKQNQWKIDKELFKSKWPK